MPPENHAPRNRTIYIACPWGPMGGGMFKVADYLIQAQAPSGSALLRPLDTRGAGSAARSLAVLAGALLKLTCSALWGELAGVHVNMAERLSLVRKSVLIVACRLLGVPVLLHLHAAQLHHGFRRMPGALQGLTRWVFSLPACCVVLGEASRRFVVQELGVPPQRVHLLTNGVPEPQVPRRRPGALRRVLFVGNLSDRKGVPELLAALAALSPGLDASRTRVCLAGGGDVAGFERQARALGLGDWVRFEGWASQQRVGELMAEADVLVLPSHDEGLPLVILEALSHGLAVLCTPVGEIPAVLQDGEHALFVPPGDVAALAQALQRLLQDDALRQRLERQGRALYESRFAMHLFFEGVARLHQACFGVSALRPACASSPATPALHSGLAQTAHMPSPPGMGLPPTSALAQPTESAPTQGAPVREEVAG